MRHTFTTMGTVASVELPESVEHSIGAIESVFRDYDEKFSLYRHDSELSRIASGELRLGDASAWMVDTYAEALTWRGRTAGAFSPHRPDGVIDLNGLVKAQAIRDAGRVLGAANADRWCINVGGDVLVCDPGAGRPWDIGIVDPMDRTSLLTAIALTGNRRAIATSGAAERGDHIWRGGSTSTPDFQQVTVVADDIVTADVLATAIMAGGFDALDDLSAAFPVDVLTVDTGGHLLATPRLQLRTLAGEPTVPTPGPVDAINP
jgi:thiamine biosynthesis lipoprotein